MSDGWMTDKMKKDLAAHTIKEMWDRAVRSLELSDDHAEQAEIACLIAQGICARAFVVSIRIMTLMETEKLGGDVDENAPFAPDVQKRFDDFCRGYFESIMDASFKSMERDGFIKSERVA